MISTGLDAIYSGLVSGIVATAVMTMSEIPSWRKWGLWGVFEWHENQILSTRFFHIARNQLNFKYIFSAFPKWIIGRYRIFSHAFNS